MTSCIISPCIFAKENKIFFLAKPYFILQFPPFLSPLYFLSFSLFIFLEIAKFQEKTHDGPVCTIPLISLFFTHLLSARFHLRGPIFQQPTYLFDQFVVFLLSRETRDSTRGRAVASLYHATCSLAPGYKSRSRPPLSPNPSPSSLPPAAAAIFLSLPPSFLLHHRECPRELPPEMSPTPWLPPHQPNREEELVFVVYLDYAREPGPERSGSSSSSTSVREELQGRRSSSTASARRRHLQASPPCQ